MTTIWQNDDGDFEDGCGCTYAIISELNGEKRAELKSKSKSCKRHAAEPAPVRRTPNPGQTHFYGDDCPGGHR